MFNIKPLLKLEVHYNELTFPICITVKTNNGNNGVNVVLTKKNTVQDLSAIIARLMKINADAKTKTILIEEVQIFINLITGNGGNLINGYSYIQLTIERKGCNEDRNNITKVNRKLCQKA